MIVGTRKILMSVALLATATAANAGADGAVAGTAPPAIVAHCEQCHGAAGNSASGAIPRLNGQEPGYLLSRLKAFRYPASLTPKATHAMWNLTTHISDQDIPIIAQYYASQPATSASQNGGQLAQEGRRIYERGASGQVPACQTCHGSYGQGVGLTPQLSGQHAQYLEDQLKAFVLTMRPHPVMSFQNKYLTDSQIKALAAYLAGP